MRLKKTKISKTMLRCCHQCGYINEAEQEMEECQKCEAPFLPLLYMEKIHSPRKEETPLYAQSNDIKEKDLIKGLCVLW